MINELDLMDDQSWKTGNSLGFDAALVVSSSDLELSIVSPSFVPAVHDDPVRSSVLNSPSDHLDGVTSQSTSTGVVVNSALVSQKVVVDSEGNLDGSIGHDLSLDLSNLGRNTVNG